MEEKKSNNRCCFPPAGPAPWLVYTHGNARSKKFQTFCTISSSPPYTTHYFKSIPQLRGKSIFSSNDGWLVLRDLDNLKIFTLWNPISSQVINLPPLNLLEEGVLISCALVCPPPEDDGDVNVFVFVDGIAFSYRPYRDNNTWIAHSTELLGQRADVIYAIICNGVIYGSVSVTSGDDGLYTDFVIIEVNNHGSDFDGPILLRSLEVECPDPEFRYTTNQKHWLVSCGRVYNIGIYLRNGDDKQICAVNIWELDLYLTKWVRVKDLEGRAFFVGEKCCTWCWGSTYHNDSGRVKHNSVYFEVSGIEGFGAQEALYLYNLDDCSLTSLLPCPNLPSPWYIPTWVMPQYQRLARDEPHVQRIEEIGRLEQGSGSIHCQGLQEQNELDTQHGSCRSGIWESSNALSLTFDKQKQTGMLDKFLLLCELPPDLIAFVAQKMHLFDYLNLRSTCKEFRSITPIARWRTNNLYPLLLFFESEEPLCSLMDPCRSDSRYMVIPELFRGVVHVDFSKDGWLLLRTNRGLSLHFFNPFTRVRGEFPPFQSLHNFSSIGFSSCPTSSDCVTVGICCEGYVQICYHRFEEEIWHVCEFDYDEVEFRSLLSSPVYHKGAFYFLDIRGYLGVFQLVNEQGVWDVHGKPQTLGDDTFHSSHLVECGGELLSVFIGDMGYWVQVFRLDQRKMKWVRVKSLGNHVLFVGPSSCFSMVAKEREMGNRIYLPRRCGNGILFYALDTGKYGTLMGEESFEDFTGTKEYVRCSWI